MKVPDTTHFQFLVLTILGDVELSGQAVRKGLAATGNPRSGPTFYLMMQRMESVGYATGRYLVATGDGKTLKTRLYRTTRAGRAARSRALKFYAAFIPAEPPSRSRT